MPAMTTEAILGWTVIAGFGYIIGEYTDVFAYLLLGPRKAGGALRSGLTTDRILGAGGLVGGLLAGPALLEIGATALAGLAGGAAGVIAIDSLGLQLSGGELAAVGVVAVVAWSVASYGATEDDD